MCICMDRLCKTTLSAYSYSTICLTQFLFYWSIVSGKTIRIDMKTDPSVYPCLDSFDILMSTPNITDDKYIRVIRVYTSNHLQRYYANTLKLQYIREYKLPNNNFLKVDCHFFEAHFRYYCFVFVALSRTTGAVLINGKPHCRPTTMQMIVTSTATASPEDNIIDSLANGQNVNQLRPAGPSYKYNYPSKPVTNNIYVNSKRIGSGSSVGIRVDDSSSQSNDEEIVHYIGVDCKCSDYYNIESNVSTVIISLGLIMCNNNYMNGNNHFNNNNNNILNIDRDRDEENIDSYSETDLTDQHRNEMKKKYLSGDRYSDGDRDGSNYSGILSTICILNLKEKNYKMKVQFESNFPVIYVESTQTPQLVVREGRLAIDPQLDINNKSQIHSMKSQFLRIESSYSQNLTLKLILFKGKSVYKKESFNVFLSTLTPIHYTSMVLILLITVCLLALILISLTSPQRKTIVKIVTPSEEGDQTCTSYMAQTDVISQFSLAEDNQSLEMDYYDYLLPFVPRPLSRISEN